MTSIVQKVLNPTYVPDPLLFVTSIVQKVFKAHLCFSTFVTGLLTALTPMTRTQGTYIGVEETTKMTISLNIMIV